MQFKWTEKRCNLAKRDSFHLCAARKETMKQETEIAIAFFSFFLFAFFVFFLFCPTTKCRRRLQKLPPAPHMPHSVKQWNASSAKELIT